jgi:hypothetical protein
MASSQTLYDMRRPLSPFRQEQSEIPSRNTHSYKRSPVLHCVREQDAALIITNLAPRNYVRQHSGALFLDRDGNLRKRQAQSPVRLTFMTLSAGQRGSLQKEETEPVGLEDIKRRMAINAFASITRRHGSSYPPPLFPSHLIRESVAVSTVYTGLCHMY